MYSDVEVTWSIAAGYRADCGDGAGENGTDCQANETPLTHFVVYYSKTRGFSQANAEGNHEQAAPGGTGATAAAGKATVKGLTPATTYYFRIAAKNSRGVGDLHAAELMVMTDPAPKPGQVTGVSVTAGDKMLTVTWDPANPDVDANRTNHTIAMYKVQYRESQTVTNNAGALDADDTHGGDGRRDDGHDHRVDQRHVV